MEGAARGEDASPEFDEEQMALIADWRSRLLNALPAAVSPDAAAGLNEAWVGSAAPTAAPSAASPALEFAYTNWRGERSNRRVQPIRLYHGSTEWHPDPQWLLEAVDLDKGEVRAFAVKDMVPSATPAAGEALTEALESIACHADEVASKSETERRRAEDGTKTGVAHASLYLGMKVAAESIAEEVRRRAAALAAARKEG
jgi:hypothetical protein